MAAPRFPARVRKQTKYLLSQQSTAETMRRKRENDEQLEANGTKRVIRDVKNAEWLASTPRLRLHEPDPPPRALPPRADELGVWRDGAYYRRDRGSPIEEAREVVGAERNARLGATYLSAMRTAQVTSAFNVRYGGVFVNTL